MDDSGACLGLSISGRQLYYAVNEPGPGNHLHHIGCIDFNFSLKQALSEKINGIFSGIRNTISNLGKKYDCDTARILTPADQECWSTFPRLVYETPDEREDHLAILMGDIPRDQLETTWFPLSNQDFRLLLVRNRERFEPLKLLLHNFSSCDYVSEFEIGSEWHRLTGIRGSYLTINAYSDHLAISSFLLGKLRGATCIPYESTGDLPYLWNFYASHLSWMDGIHEQAYIYGENGAGVRDVLNGTFEETGKALLMNSLDTMRVQAEEKTYGFPLENAFPAVLLSLNHESIQK